MQVKVATEATTFFESQVPNVGKPGNPQPLFAAISESLETNRIKRPICALALPGVKMYLEDSRVFKLDRLEGFVLLRSSRQRQRSGTK